MCISSNQARSLQNRTTYQSRSASTQAPHRSQTLSNRSNCASSPFKYRSVLNDAHGVTCTFAHPGIFSILPVLSIFHCPDGVSLPFSSMALSPGLSDVFFHPDSGCASWTRGLRGSCELLQALSQQTRDGGPPCLEVMHRCPPGFPTVDFLFPFGC